MKKIILSMSILTLLFGGVSAQIVNIPDANFKAYLLGEAAINTNSDSEIQVSEASAFSGALYCSVLNISDLTGIEAFTSLTELYCNQNNLTTLNVSQNTQLTDLQCLFNSLTTLDVSNNTALKLLYCHTNNITSLDVSNNPALTDLICYDNDLVTLNLGSNNNLTNLNCRNNNLTNLNCSQCVNLSTLGCRSNNLNNLDVSQNTSLTVLECNSNNISILDLRNNPLLTYLKCNNNNLTALNMKNINTSTLSNSNFSATVNPNLTCIDVDDVATATSTWTNIDAASSFSVDCGLFSEIIENTFDNQMLIYPNPAKSQLTIDSKEFITTIKIMDLMGKTIQPISVQNNTVDVSDLTKGIYLLQIQTDKGMVSKKFNKE